MFQIYTLYETKKPKDAKGVVMIDQKDWKIYNGLHEDVKTQEEHDFIVMHLARKTKIAKRSTAKETYPLTKILKCGYCGHFLGFQQRQERQLEVRKCWYTDPYGVKCTNMSVSMVQINEAVQKAVEDPIRDVELKITGVDTARIEDLKNKVQELERSVKAHERSLVKEQEAYRANIYDVDEYKVIVLEFKQLMAKPNLTYEIQNELYKTILKCVDYKRTEAGGIELNILFKLK